MLKRLFDIVFAILSLGLLTPLLIILALFVKIKLGSPILFTQVRPGKNGNPFTFYKFRTMNNKTDKDGNILPDEDRITSFGQYLRKTSMDELPSFFNVLKGEMSMVGPRPLLMKYLPLYNEFQKRRHDVKPGITGWAQINGRNSLSWQKKFEFDVWYVNNQSFWLDLKILLFTLFKVFKREGISADGEVTMPPFTGNHEL